MKLTQATLLRTLAGKQASPNRGMNVDRLGESCWPPLALWPIKYTSNLSRNRLRSKQIFYPFVHQKWGCLQRASQEANPKAATPDGLQLLTRSCLKKQSLSHTHRGLPGVFISILLPRIWARQSHFSGNDRYWSSGTGSAIDSSWMEAAILISSQYFRVINP